MSSVFATLTLLFIGLSAPTLLGTDTSKYLTGHVLCVLHGTTHLIFHPLALWTVAGIHLDRFISIVNPLR